MDSRVLLIAAEYADHYNLANLAEKTHELINEIKPFGLSSTQLLNNTQSSSNYNYMHQSTIADKQFIESRGWKSKKKQRVADVSPQTTNVIKTSDLRYSSGSRRKRSKPLVIAKNGPPRANEYCNKLSNERFRCDFSVSHEALCSKEFKTRDQCLEHVCSHTGESRFRCLICNREFAGRANCKRHIKNLHH
jgi:hypothetical protein